MTRALGVAGLVVGGFLMTASGVAGAQTAASADNPTNCPVSTNLSSGSTDPSGTPIIQTSAPAPITPISTTSTGQLAFTGADVGGMLALGGGLLGGGVLLVQLSRRRQQVA